MVHECGLKGQENILGGRVQGLPLPDFIRERAKRWRGVGSPFFSNTHFKPSVCFFSIKCHLKFHSSFACDDIAGWILSPAYYTFIWSLSFNAFRFLERAKMSHFSFIFSAQYYSKKGDFATALTIDDIIKLTSFSRLFLPVFSIWSLGK